MRAYVVGILLCQLVYIYRQVDVCIYMWVDVNVCEQYMYVCVNKTGRDVMRPTARDELLPHR